MCRKTRSHDSAQRLLRCSTAFLGLEPALSRNRREISQPLRRHHLLDDFGFVIDHKMRIALDHR